MERVITIRFRTFLLVIVFLLTIITVPVIGQLKLKDRHPDEPARHTFHERFSLKNSLSAVKQIDKAFESFRKLTGRSRERLSHEEISKIGNMSSEAQSLGFHNWVGAVEGTLRKQNYQIQKLEFELAQAKYETGKIGEDELEKEEIRYKKAEKEFKRFWDSFTIAD